MTAGSMTIESTLDHRSNRNDRVPVLIAGAGPAGLIAAITLARQEIEVLIVDRHAAPSPLPRATVSSLRTMELLRSWGLERDVRAGGDDVEWSMLICASLAQASGGHTVEVGYPTTEQSAALSPTSPVCVPQDHLERVLVAHLRTLPSARIERGVAVDGLRAHDDGYAVELRDVSTGATRTVAARYVVGADGAHSVVRQRAGIRMRTTTDVLGATAVIVHAPLWALVGDRRHGIYAIDHPTASGVFLPAGRGDRWVYSFEEHPSVERASASTPDELVARLRTAAGQPDLPVTVAHVSSFSFTGGIADRFRDGRIFLVGDAAHRVTPRGGTGMNTAIADGFDLGWKLAWVLDGWAPESLLDTHEAERFPVAAHNYARSIDPGGSRRRAVDEVHVDLGGRIRHQWLPDGHGGTTSTLDLVGPGLTLVTGPTGATVPTPPVVDPLYRSAPITTRVVDGLVARGLGIAPGGGLLVRPDGVPAGLIGSLARRWPTTPAPLRVPALRP